MCRPIRRGATGSFCHRIADRLTIIHGKMTDEQERALDFLCRSSRPRPTQPDQGVPYHMRVLEEGDPRQILPEFAAALWICDLTDRLPLLSECFMRLAAKLPASSWLAVDQTMRTMVRDPGPSINRTDPSLIRSFSQWLGLKKEKNPLPAHVVIALCHRNGWTRQETFPFLDHLPHLLAASLLMVRANDWIPSIRSAAIEIIPRIIARLDSREKLHMLPLAVHLRYCGRLDSPLLPDTWIALLNESLDEQAWVEVWRKAPAREQRLYLSLLDPANQMPGEQLQQALLSSKNRLAVIFHLTRIFPHLTPEQQEATARIVALSRAVPIRRTWLEYLIQHRPDEATPLLVETLTSPSKSLRDFARYHLMRLSPMDFEVHYLKSLDTGINEAEALLGLSEVSPEIAHREALKRMAGHPPKIRKAAILSLSADWIKRNLHWFLSKTGWDSPAVWYATRKRLRSMPRTVGSFVLENPDIPDLPLAISSFLIEQSFRFKKWDGLEYLIHAIPDPRLTNDALAALQSWRHTERNSYVHLAEDRKQRLLLLMESAPLSAATRAELLFLLARAE